MTQRVPEFTVIVPTFDHVETLWFSLESALAQTLADFEIVVVGDGAPPRTAEIVAAFTARDPRVRYAPHPKGERHGEAGRHAVLASTRSRYVAYLCDDDLWFPGHLATLATLLADRDLAHTMQIDLTPDGRSYAATFDADADPPALAAMRRNAAGFGLASGGHTLAAYRRLPFGWRPAPKGINSDTYFWLQLLDQPWCRYASHTWPDVIHLSLVPPDWPAARRTAEVAAIAARAADQAWREDLVRRVLLEVHERAVRRAALAELAAAPLQHYQLGECVRFGVRGNAYGYALTGTYEREVWGVWARGTLRIVLPREPGVTGDEPLVLTIALMHFVAEPARASSAARIRVNGEMVACVEERDAGEHRYRLELPRSLAPSGAPFTIEIDGERAVSPRSLGLSEDARELSVGVGSLSIGRSGG